ncbi:MAG: hypothetical protein Q8R47_02780 [Nanoarchaeota archaeon]|nr:hypothetical protein [Nanoarchaeota archaeon]
MNIQITEFIYTGLNITHNKVYGQFGCPEKDATIAASVWRSTNATVSGLKLTAGNLCQLKLVYGAKKITCKTYQ